MKTIAVDGVTLAYEDRGQGEPIVFIHGFPASSYSWRRVAEAFAPSYRTVSFDLMGFGDSDKPREESYTLARQCELIGEAISRMGLDRVILAGHSMGGGVCLSLLRKLGPESKMVSGLVLINTVCYPQRLPWFMNALKIPVLPELGMKLIPEQWGFHLLEGAMYHPENGMKPEAMSEYTRSLRSKGGHAALVKAAKQIVPADVNDLVASYSYIGVPTLIIWGKQDNVLPAALGQRLAKQIPRATYMEIDTCGHCPQEEKPEMVIDAMKKFTADLKI